MHSRFLIAEDQDSVRLEILTKKTPFIIRLTFILLIVVLVCIPPIIFLVNATTNEDPSFGIFLAWIPLGFFAFIFLRIVLWNTYGKEVFTITEQGISYFADFRFFKDALKHISGKSFEVMYVNDPSDHYFQSLVRKDPPSVPIHLVFQGDDDRLVVAIQLAHTELLQIVEALQRTYFGDRFSVLEIKTSELNHAH